MTNKYDFEGKVINSERVQGTLNIKNHYIYDHAGRKKEVYQQMNSDPEVELACYNYNELGQLVRKNLHGNNLSTFQNINYRYNIRGWLTSINNANLVKDTLNEDDNDAFGEELRYNISIPVGNITTGTDQWNGNISGIKWKTKGPQVDANNINVNAYAFQYDKLNRMTMAGYGAWNNSTILSSSSGRYDESLSYDPMGNISNLLRKGIQGPIDNLTYHYKQNELSNQLASVTDAINDPTGFKDGTNSGDDYFYDGNGNLITDNNKGLTINYNLLNLPQSVSSTQGTIEYIYDASGKKLKKTFTGQTDHYYMDGIEYSGSTMLFAMTEEGRVRPSTVGYTYDYFLKDHLGNIRVVLSSAADTVRKYPIATMEMGSAGTEETFYANIGTTREDKPSGFDNDPGNLKVARLTSSGNRQIGPSITLKVNSGDVLNLSVKSFYQSQGANYSSSGLVPTVLTQLLDALLNPMGLNVTTHSTATDALNNTGFGSSSSYTNMLGGLPNSSYNNSPAYTPKAYMVWMLFDDEFNLVKTGNSSGLLQVTSGADQMHQLAQTGITMDKSGFFYAYVENESPMNVYFDDFQVSTSSSQVLEENTYYPFGMLNAQLSAPGITDPINNYKYNGKELQKELNLEWLDYGARFYDPVIGRWHVIDPITELFNNISPYTYCTNNPIIFIDNNGLWPIKKVVDNGIVGNRGFSITPVWNPYHQLFRPHYGQDFPTPEGNKIHALADGVVSDIGFNPGGWGNYVVIKHLNGYTTRYAHIKNGGIKVKIGDVISDGQVFALSGRTGGAKGPHVHVEMYLNGKPINPMYIPDLQVLLKSINDADEDEDNNDKNPKLLPEVLIIGKAQHRITLEEQMKNMQWQIVRQNTYGNTGRYNKEGRLTDQYYCDEFLKWYYGEVKK